mmetsp:Transcript_71865/g.208251  ORF Transcript_71865/g.208251 Transcript_71865/m.208251 type:complete len:232 (+) Transcript_71865:1247-1942(+)
MGNVRRLHAAGLSRVALLRGDCQHRGHPFRFPFRAGCRLEHFRLHCLARVNAHDVVGSECIAILHPCCAHLPGSSRLRGRPLHPLLGKLATDARFGRPRRHHIVLDRVLAFHRHLHRRRRDDGKRRRLRGERASDRNRRAAWLCGVHGAWAGGQHRVAAGLAQLLRRFLDHFCDPFQINYRFRLDCLRSAPRRHRVVLGRRLAGVHLLHRLRLRERDHRHRRGHRPAPSAE